MKILINSLKINKLYLKNAYSNYFFFNNYTILIKLLITLFLFLIFTYVFYFSLKNIVNYWTYSEIHINYSLGFVKRGLLGSVMLYLESIGLSKNIFFSSIFYLITLCNIFLFLNLINKFKKYHLFFFIFFSLNPALILFNFYDLGGYARTEIFGISICLLHTFFAQKFYHHKIDYKKYLKLLLTVICPLSLIIILIHELNILFLAFHFFTTLIILIKNKFKEVVNFKYLIIINVVFLTFITSLLLTHPFSKEFAKELYDNLENKDGTSFWIWASIAGTFSERINSEIHHMLIPSGAISLYFFIFLFYLIPIFFLLSKTSEKNKFYLLYIFLSALPFALLFFIGRDWGRWIHIIIFVIFCCLIQFKEKKINIPGNYKFKILTYLFLIFIAFQFIFTRIPHCCNLVKLNLDIFGGILPKVQVFYKMFNNDVDIKKRFQTY
jgi:hypothetical protein